MDNHKWSQKAFTDGGYYHGFQTCLNLWACKSCGLEIELPLGINPKQYDHIQCKGGNDNVYRTNPDEMSKVRSDGGMLQGNRHDKRVANVQNMHKVR